MCSFANGATMIQAQDSGQVSYLVPQILFKFCMRKFFNLVHESLCILV